MREAEREEEREGEAERGREKVKTLRGGMETEGDRPPTRVPFRTAYTDSNGGQASMTSRRLYK